jgi:hypothetical protein
MTAVFACATVLPPDFDLAFEATAFIKSFFNGRVIHVGSNFYTSDTIL